jgi:flagellar basal body-associated protein FliL
MSDAAAAQTAKPAAPAGGNRNVLVIALVAVNMLGMLGLGAYLVLGGSAGAQARDGDQADESGDEESDDLEDEEGGGGAPHEIGPLVEFESMVVNLNEPSTDRYLKLTFQLELTDAEMSERVESHMAPFRDAVLMYLTSLHAAEVSGPEHAAAVRDHLLQVANQTMGRRTVRHVYFTEYLVQ